MRALVLILALTLLPLPALAQCPGQELLSCPIGKKQLELCLDADGVSYSFGPKGRPEITLATAIRDTDYQPWSGVGRAMWDAVRFTNQGTTYEVWTSLDRMAENAGWEGGVNVLKGEEMLASLTCAPGSVRGDLGDIFDAKTDAGQCWNFDSFAWQDTPCP
jgi:hypothetical protein